MIVCPNCSKENQDHYKFCLGCGAKLPAPGQAAPPPPPQPASSPVPPPAPPNPYPAAPPPPPAAAPPQAAPPPQPAPPQPAPPQAAPPPQAPQGPYGQPQQGTYGQQAPASAPPQQPQAYGSQPASAPAGMRRCPNCQTENPAQFKFCGACGNTLEAAAPGPSSGLGSPPSSAPVAPPQGDTSVGPAPSPPPAEAPAAKTMFMDAGHQPPVAPAAAGPATIRLVLLLEDGTEGGVLVIEGGPERVGRGHGPPFDSDAYLDLDHAELTATSQGLVIDALESLNGVYLKLEGRAELQHGDFFRVGQELLYYEDLPEPTPTEDGTERMGSPNPGYWGRVSVMVSPDRAVAAYPIQDESITIGREGGAITFPDDGYVSGTHCNILGDDEGVFLEDLGSSNGTYMRVRKGQCITTGNLILIGQQLFRIEAG